jgi:DNA gyrase subunit B
VKTAVGRSLRVTASHSLFVYEDGEVRRKRGDELRRGDRVVAPKQIRLPGGAPARIDLLRELHASLAEACPEVRAEARLEALAEIRAEARSDGPGEAAAGAPAIWLRGPAVAAWFAAKVTGADLGRPHWSAPRLVLPSGVRRELAARRRAAKISNGQLCQLLGIGQPGTFHAWELGTSRPTQVQLEAYVLAIGADPAAVQAQSEEIKARYTRIFGV